MAIFFMDIPKEFYSTLTGTPMKRCIDCERPLLEEGVEYIIEKAVRYYPEYALENTIFEYAICVGCATRMMSTMSKQSLEHVGKYFEQRVDMGQRHRRFTERDEPPTLEELIGHCMVNGTPKDENIEYQICGQFVGERMVLGHMPYMIGMAAMEEVQELLSPETKRELDDFVGDNFGLPPEWKKAMEERPTVLV